MLCFHHCSLCVCARNLNSLRRNKKLHLIYNYQQFGFHLPFRCLNRFINQFTIILPLLFFILIVKWMLINTCVAGLYKCNMYGNLIVDHMLCLYSHIHVHAHKCTMGFLSCQLNIMMCQLQANSYY